MKQWQIFLMAGLFLAVCNSLGDAEAATSPVTISSDISSTDIMVDEYTVATLTFSSSDTTYRTMDVYLVASWASGVAWSTYFFDTDDNPLDGDKINLSKGGSGTVKFIVMCDGLCSAGDINTVQVNAKTDPEFYNYDGNVTDTCGSDDCRNETTPAWASSNFTNTITMTFTAWAAYDSMVTCDSASAYGDNRVFQGNTYTYLWGYTLKNTGWNTDTYKFTSVVTSDSGLGVGFWMVLPGLADGKELTGQGDSSSTAVHKAAGSISIIPASNARPGVYNIELEVASINSATLSGCDFDVVIPEPDLEIFDTDISFSKYGSCLRANETSGRVTITAKVRNNGGSVDASGVRTVDIGVIFYVDGARLGSGQTIQSLDYGEEIWITTNWDPVRAHDNSEYGIPIKVVVDPSDKIEEMDSSNNEGESFHKVTEYQTTTGIEGGEVIGYDVALARATGSWIASVDGSVWTVIAANIEPQISIDLVHWYLLDGQGNTVSDGLISDIDGYYSGQGKAVVFIDTDFNCKLSQGDKFEVHPGEADSDLASVSDVDDYSMRFKTESSTSSEEEETIEEEEIQEEPREVPSISLVPALISIGIIAIFRRK